jgi:RHS repeat-associated core domain
VNIYHIRQIQNLYDSFGNIKDKTENVNNTILYAGYQYDPESGLYYLNARMYDPVTARFMQEDSYKGNNNDPLSLNLYTYCHNEPLMYTDPTGHSWKSFWKGVKSIAKDFWDTGLEKSLSGLNKKAKPILQKALKNAGIKKDGEVYSNIKFCTVRVESVAVALARNAKGITQLPKLGKFAIKTIKDSYDNGEIKVKHYLKIGSLADDQNYNSALKISNDKIKSNNDIWKSMGGSLLNDFKKSIDGGLTYEYLYNPDLSLHDACDIAQSKINALMLLYGTGKAVQGVSTKVATRFGASEAGYASDTAAATDVERAAQVGNKGGLDDVALKLTGNKKLYYEATGKIPTGEVHHTLPQQFADEFAEVGLDVNSGNFLFDIPKDVHRLKPDGLHTTTNPLGQTWNAAWKDFFMKNPDFSKADVLNQWEYMIQKTGIDKFK